MGVFVNYLSLPIAGLSSTPTSILTATTNQLIVTNLVVCNYLERDMRFNLKKIRTFEGGNIEIFYLVDYEIKALQSVDILSSISTNINDMSSIILEYNVTPAISDSLICYSNGYTQVFDCEISYMQLNELPMS